MGRLGVNSILLTKFANLLIIMIDKMKKVKFAALFAAFVSVIGFSSCLGDDKTESYDLYDYVTLTDVAGSTSRLKSMISDTYGLTLEPQNESVIKALKLTDGSYYERAYVGVKLVEDIEPTRTKYTVSEMQVVEAIPYQGFNQNPDTLDAMGYGNHGFTAVSKNTWAKTGFLTVPFELRVLDKHASTFYKDIHMYIDKASNDTLYTRLRYVRENMEGMAYQFLMSFKLPKANPIYYQMRPKNDSIIIKVTAPYNEFQNVESFAKCRFSELVAY